MSALLVFLKSYVGPHFRTMRNKLVVVRAYNDRRIKLLPKAMAARPSDRIKYLRQDLERWLAHGVPDDARQVMEALLVSLVIAPPSGRGVIEQFNHVAGALSDLQTNDEIDQGVRIGITKQLSSVLAEIKTLEH